MSKRAESIITELEALSNYTGSWITLSNETNLLKKRIEELHDREDNLSDVLIIALVGGSGVGKSTLLNALAGDELAKTKQAIHGYLSRRFMQQKKADDMRELEKRPSLHFPGG